MGLPSTSSSLACHEDSYPCGLLMGQAKVTIPVILSLLCASPGVPRHSATNWVTIKTMQMYPLMVLEAGSLKSKSWQDHIPSHTYRGGSFLASSRFWKHHSHLCLCHHWGFFLCVFMLSSICAHLYPLYFFV